MSKAEPLLVTPPALLILGFVVKGGVSIKQQCCSLVPPYGWIIWSHQNKTTPSTSSGTRGKHWVTLTHTHRHAQTHTHTQGHTLKNREKKVKGASRWLSTLDSQVTGTNFPKQHFILIFPLWRLCYVESCHIFPFGYRVTADQSTFLNEWCVKTIFHLWTWHFELR